MKRIILQLLFIVLFLTSCGTKKNIFLIQENNINTPVEITFFNYKNYTNGNIILRKKLIVDNTNNWKYANVYINYFKDGIIDSEVFARPTEFNRKYNRFINIVNDKIIVEPFHKKKIIYEVKVYINNINSDSIYKSLERYKDLALPVNTRTINPQKTIDDIFTYQEPFSEFKRKNPELLEFLTKGDSIELEVISPVKQKYKFKAEW